MNVTIAGAGIVGCTVAYELARRGASVTVFDPRGAGQGATQASAGMLAPAIEGHSPALLRLLECGLARYDEFIARLRQDTLVEVEYGRHGTIQVAVDDQEAATLAAAAARLGPLDIPFQWCDADEASRLEPALSGVVAALLIPQHGYVVADSLVRALTAAASRYGVRFESEEVLAVSGSSSGAVLSTPTRRVESDAAIVAAGSWSSALAAPRLHPSPIRPIRGQILRLRAPSRVLTRVVWSGRCYLVPRRDGSVLVGATVEDVGFDETPTADAVENLLAAGRAVVPALGHATFEEVRVGLRPAAGDELPVIGRSSTMPHVFLATGHYRSGVLLAPLTAALVADLVLEGRASDELETTRPDRLGL